MATADELLGLAVTDPILTIDWESRQINIPSAITNLGVETDDDVKVLKFQAPRFYHGSDLSTFKVRIYYLNANKEGDIYKPTDLVVDEDTMTFSWVVDRYATMYKGDVQFAVEMVLTKEAESAGLDAIDKEVNTTVSSLPVLEGIDVDEEAVVEEHRDVITTAVLEAFQRAVNSELRGERGERGRSIQPVSGRILCELAERNELIPEDTYLVTERYVKRYDTGENIYAVGDVYVAADPGSFDLIDNIASGGAHAMTGDEFCSKYDASDIVENDVYFITEDSYNKWPKKGDVVVAHSGTYHILYNIIGRTPIRGTDYWTEEDKNTIIADLNGNFGNALKGSAAGSGAGLRIDDALPIQHTVKAKIYGRNLANPAYFEIGKSIYGGGPGYTVAYNDNVACATLIEAPVKPATKYIFTLDNTNYFLDRMCELDANHICTYNHGFYFNPDTADYNEFVWTTKDNSEFISIRLHKKDGTEPTLEELEDVHLMVAEYVDENSGAYEPFIDVENAHVKVYGKNLINVDYVTTGNISAYYHELCTDFEPVIGQTYTFSVDVHTTLVPFAVAIGCGQTGFTGELEPYCAKDFSKVGRCVITFTWNISEEHKTLGYTKLAIRVPRYMEEKTFSAAAYNFQLEIGNADTGYEPYVAPASYTPGKYGDVDVISVAPTMTIIADNSDVTIEAEYSKDVNRVVGDISAALDEIMIIADELIGGDDV